MEWHICTGDDVLDRWITDCFADFPFLPGEGTLYVTGEENAARLLATGGIVIWRNETYLSSQLHRTLSENPAYAAFPLPLPLADFFAFLHRFSQPNATAISPILPEDAPWRWDMEARALLVGEEKIVFTPREWQILQLLWAAGGRPVARGDIERAVWSNGANSNACDVYAAHLRKKLSPYFGPSVLTGIRGGGYALRLPRRIFSDGTV